MHPRILITVLALLLATPAAQAASDCSLARDEIERDKCYAQNAAEAQRNRDAVRRQHESYVRPQEQDSAGAPPGSMERLRQDLEMQAEWRRRMEEQAAEQRYLLEYEAARDRKAEEEYRLWKRAEASRVEAAAKARVEAARAAIADPAMPTPFEHLRLIDAALPLRSLAVLTAEEALLAWPDELAFAGGLALTLSCPPGLQTTPGNSEACDFGALLPSVLQRMSGSFNGGPVVDRMRFCTLVHAHTHYVRKEMRRGRVFREMYAPSKEMLEPYLKQCDQGIPEVPARAREKLWQAIAELARDCCTGVRHPDNFANWEERWNFLMHPGWKTLDAGGYTDTDLAVQLLMDARYYCIRDNDDKRCDSMGGIGWQAAYLAPRRPVAAQ